MGLPADTAIRPGDCVFLRPTQSAAVLQQFGPIAVLSGGRICGSLAGVADDVNTSDAQDS
ncbi:hypothetical protein [Mesorhizobium sp. B2-4-17]|uniref:hypothetical protein n=1 Tax=Mesorhizobium sp. B2-4-17 TaxID=2589932 RepID=UPI001FED6DB0|nr:hypothetical protein [Mesorhizobium sp. B2-4-17]